MKKRPNPISTIEGSDCVWLLSLQHDRAYPFDRRRSVREGDSSRCRSERPKTSKFQVSGLPKIRHWYSDGNGRRKAGFSVGGRASLRRCRIGHSFWLFGSDKDTHLSGDVVTKFPIMGSSGALSQLRKSGCKAWQFLYKNQCLFLSPGVLYLLRKNLKNIFERYEGFDQNRH